jgi:hypothetical protein
VLVRGVLFEKFAVRGALEGLEAGFAFDAEGGDVLHMSELKNFPWGVSEGEVNDVRISAGSSPRLCRPFLQRARASAVLCEEKSVSHILCS